MTKEELSQLYWLNREIEREERRLKELEAAATDTSAKITGLPRMGGLTDKTEIAVEIADSKKIIETKKKLCLIEYNRLMRYIANVPDSLMRQILTYRHIEGMNWYRVARAIGGGNTADGVRKAHDRFLQK